MSEGRRAASGDGVVTRLLVAALVFGSGLSALTYQLAWTREFRLIFGASTAAVSAVLAIFSAGLGIGGAWLGPRADRHPRPLRLYGLLELGIAAFAALTPVLFGPLRALYLSLGGSAALGPVGGTAVRLVLASMVLAVPTVLMGGTLPAAVRGVQPSADAGRRSVGVLYATNTLGAVAGAACATFFAFERLGTRRSLWVAAALNAAVGSLAMVLARRARVSSSPESDAARPSEAASTAAARRHAPPRFVCGAALVTGFVFFAMELVWYRMLGPILGGSVFTFGLILAMALLGIACGGALHGVFGRKPALSLLSLTCALEAAFLAAPVALGDRVALLALALRPAGAGTLATLVPGWAVVTAVVVLAPAIVAGFQYPLLIALLGEGRRDVGAHAGRASLFNMAGSVLGALVAGFWAIPRLGAVVTWRLLVVATVMLGAAALVMDRRREADRPSPSAAEDAVPVVFVLPRLRAEWVAGVLLGALAVASVVFPEGPTAAWRHGSIGVGRVERTVLASPNAFRAFRNDVRRSIAWETDGIESSVALDAQDGLAFVVNGKVDGNARNDAATQVMGGLLGAILHGSPKTAAVIGLGTGSSAGWLAAVPSIERVDVAELEPAMLEVARRCASVNRDVLHDPKVHVVLGDARETLIGRGAAYDVVFSEPSNPYRAGVASLFSQEYYEAVAQRLRPGGVFLQWVQLYELERPTLETIYATLSSVFHEVQSWRLGSQDLVLVASREPAPLDARDLRRIVAEEPYRSALRVAWRTEGLEGLLAHHVGRPSLARRFAARGRINTDDQNVLEYAFARSVGNFADLGGILEAAREQGEALPELQNDEVDRVRVEEERRFALASEGIEPSVPEGLAPDEEVRATALVNYVAGNVGGAMERWRFQSRPPRGHLEIALVAEGLAEEGSAEAGAAIEELRSFDVIEADMLRARWLDRQGKHVDAVRLAADAFARLRADPWPAPAIVRRALELAEEMASQDLDSSLRLIRALREPFAVRVLDAARKQARLAIAQRIVADNECGPAWSELEPHVPWNQLHLDARTACYRFFLDPKRERAASDRETFQSCERGNWLSCF